MAKWQNGKKPRTKSRGTQDVLIKKLHMKKCEFLQKTQKTQKNANLQKGNEW